MRRRMQALGLAAIVAWAAPAEAEDPVVQDVLDILKQRGIVDEGQYTDLTARNAAYEDEHEALLGRIEFTGDFRFRMENLWFQEDETGVDRDDRTRLRYRLRVQGRARVNEHVDAVFRLASGEAANFDEGANRSTNRTLGRGNDFSYDPIFLDLAYLDVRAPGDWVEGASLQGLGGRMPNPFRWKIGKDFLLWDPDITPGGAAARLGYAANDATQLFLNTGYFVLDENDRTSDPHVFGIQGGAHVDVAEGWRVGARGSFYSWRSLNGGFFGRSESFGTIADGLTHGAPTVRASSFGVVEVAAYLGYDGIEGWPVVLYGHYVNNLDAEASELFPAAGEEDTGWGLGVEVGDKREVVALGLGFYRVEANFWPAQFMDSDITDGFTNRQGWHLYGTREILPNTDLAVELLWSDELRTSLPAFAASVPDAERLRLRTDLVVKF